MADSSQKLVGADVAIVVNRNNPDGRRWSRRALLDLLGQVGLLVIHESFMDTAPDQSLAPIAGCKRLIILRSLGKFFGLGPVRLGFARGDPELRMHISLAVSPWPVSGAAIEVGATALRDQIGIAKADPASAAAQMDALLLWAKTGSCDLFARYEVGDAGAVQAAQHILTRRFPWKDRLLRLVVPALTDLLHRRSAVHAWALGQPPL